LIVLSKTHEREGRLTLATCALYYLPDNDVFY